jgi:hypothetical protein
MYNNDILFGHIVITVPTKMYLRDIVYALSTSDLELFNIKSNVYQDPKTVGAIIYISFEKKITDKTIKISNTDFVKQISKVLEKSNIKYFSISTLFGAIGGAVYMTCSNIEYPE